MTGTARAVSRAKVTHVHQSDRGRRLRRQPRISERWDRVAGLSARNFEVHGILDVGRFEGGGMRRVSMFR
jgi:hypothetical protein